MAMFPTLKTGAEAQYGFERIEDRPVRTQHFLDGRTRRFTTQRARRGWKLKLRGLSANEAIELASFVSDHLNTNATFTFRDPWTGQEYDDCEVPASSYRVETDGDFRFIFEILIEQRQV